MKSIANIVNENYSGEAIDYLIENKDCFVVSQEELNKIKAEAVREAIEESCHLSELDGEAYCDPLELEEYANKIEEGEL